MAEYREVGSLNIGAAADQLLAKIAAEVAADASAIAPVDTGYLAANIDSELTGPGRARVTAHAHYAIFVERGTSRARAQPFLRPALYKRRGA